MEYTECMVNKRLENQPGAFDKAAKQEKILSTNDNAFGNKPPETKNTEKMTDEEVRKADEIATEIDLLRKSGNIVALNQKIHDPALSKFISPDLRRKIVAEMREIDTERISRDIQSGNMGAVKLDVAQRLEEVSTGYNELFKNLNQQREKLWPLSEESDMLASLSEEVQEAENMVNQLLSRIKTIENAPRQNNADQPPASTNRETLEPLSA